jgi:hypothetical protein
MKKLFSSHQPQQRRIVDNPSAKIASKRAPSPRLRVLFIEKYVLVPFASWRINEIRAFIERYDTDFFSAIHRITHGDNTHKAGRAKLFAWSQLYKTHSLHLYDILIFHPMWNFLSRHQNANQKGGAFDARRFNHTTPGGYMLRLRKFRREGGFRLDSYDVFYTLFLDRAYSFNAMFPPQTRPPPDRQVVKAFPGGGMIRGPFCNWPNETWCRPLCCPAEGQGGANLQLFRDRFRELLGPKHAAVHYITTQAHTRDAMRELFPSNPHRFVLGGAVFYDPLKLVNRSARRNVNVCFTSIGNFTDKGGRLFFQLVDAFRATYPRDNVTFYTIGVAPKKAGVRHIKKMAQAKLDRFYQELPLNVFINLQIAAGINGWPLGLEALAHGAALVSTDPLDMNSRNGLNWGEEFTMVRQSSTNSTFELAPAVQKLHAYATNRLLLHAHAVKMQRNVERNYSTQVHMRGIFEYLDNALGFRTRMPGGARWRIV